MQTITAEQYANMEAAFKALGMTDADIENILSRRVQVMSTPAVAPVAAVHVPWLKKVGHFFGAILKFVGTEEPKIAAIATPALELAFPQFATLIASGDALATKITKQILVTETLATAVGSATTGTDKVNAALAGVGPEIDAWVAAAFPGSKALSTPGKTALISAFVALANEVEADVIPPPPAK
jgi:hypothetical protein